MNAEGLLRHFDRIADAPEAIGRMRRFILDLAVRGKLVLQDHTDEPASTLLARILVEKARLFRAGEARAPKTLPPIADAPFYIPQSWRWTQIAEIGLLNPKNDAPDDLPASFVPMTLIAAEYGAKHGDEVRPWGEIKRGYTHFANGDVGLAKITPCFENGKSAVFRSLSGGIGSGTTELHVVRPLFVDAEYIVLFFKSPHFIVTGTSRMTGTAGQKRVPTEYFAQSPFPLPPLAEQHRVVAKVDELMALCDQLEAARAKREAARDRLTAATLARLNAPDPEIFADDASFALGTLPAFTARPDQIKQLRQTILNLAVRGKLVIQDPMDENAHDLLKRISAEVRTTFKATEVCDGAPVPSTWLWTRLGTMVVSSDSGWSPKTLDHPRSGRAWGVLKVSAVSWDTFRSHANKQVLPGTEPRLQAQVKRGDFLISRANTSDLVARAVIVDEDPQHLMMSDKIVRLVLSRQCDPRYICIVNNNADFARQHYVGRASGVSPSMKNVTRDAIFDLPIPLPPLAEQHRIVAKVDELLRICDQLQKSIAMCDCRRGELMLALLHASFEPVDQVTDSL